MISIGDDDKRGGEVGSDKVYRSRVESVLAFLPDSYSKLDSILVSVTNLRL